jgi:hypothetical protein
MNHLNGRSFKPSQGDLHVHHRQRPAYARVLTSEDAYRLGPIMSEAQQAAFSQTMGGISRPAGGYTGCAYAGYDQGIVCQLGMPKYEPSAQSLFSNWTGNVDFPYGPDVPQPNVMADGTINQILAGGGGGFNPCIDDCSCQNDAACTCRNADPAMQCGYPRVGNNCLEPVPNGQFPSLSACEQATSLGFYGR